MGTLVATGTIDLKQFWPGGESDGDTTHVAVESFTFDGKETTVFDGAVVHGQGKPRAVVRKGAITVRWQGIDAPELHYNPMVKNGFGKNFRQPYGQSVTVALAKKLAALANGSDTLECRVETRVAKPNDVFDMYGRFIGTIFVGKLSLNTWMVASGLAFPTFYASMENDEIEELQTATAAARGDRLGIWGGYTSHLELDPDLVFVNHGDPNENDAGDVLMPKIFRRLTSAYAKNGTTSGFPEFLAQGKPDWCWETDDFLAQGSAAAEPHKLTNFITATRFTMDPGDLVFRESPSKIYDAKGKPITKW
jgi:endonuclease YncB( thermonuclease family)